MPNTNRIDAESAFERRIKDLGLAEGQSFYAHEVAQQAQAIVDKAGLTSAQYYMVAALLEDVAFRCLGIDPSQPWCQAISEAQNRLRNLDAHCVAYHGRNASEGQETPSVATFGGGVKLAVADVAQVSPPTIEELIANDRPD